MRIKYTAACAGADHSEEWRMLSSLMRTAVQVLSNLSVAWPSKTSNEHLICFYVNNKMHNS